MSGRRFPPGTWPTVGLVLVAALFWGFFIWAFSRGQG